MTEGEGVVERAFTVLGAGIVKFYAARTDPDGMKNVYVLHFGGGIETYLVHSIGNSLGAG